jgi:hypothetical protein
VNAGLWYVLFALPLPRVLRDRQHHGPIRTFSSRGIRVCATNGCSSYELKSSESLRVAYPHMLWRELRTWNLLTSDRHAVGGDQTNGEMSYQYVTTYPGSICGLR